ncbi:MAG: tRNA CCA-pyrophosphorylase [Bacillus sp. (in: firmicutes)]|jgi:tRNA nucleotidyltransferase (CCA-adding enzyme)|nr:tRNA CCA-pyrophosphorylase [Bacillus sp. (in: firmicutes)]
MNPLFLNAIPILEKIENAGYEAYFVGGAVRDQLLNREIADVDIASSATPEEIKQIFPNTADVGIEHGTVLVLYKGSGYEITTFRTESEYKDFRRPDEVMFIRSLEEDLKRRDFTMNAMAMNKNGNLIDPFNGQLAISRKRIETVGKAEERFAEDALRMMRAIRFVSQLSFSLDPSCFHALEKMTSLLQHIAVERKTAEFEKLLLGKNRINAINLLCKANIDHYLPRLSEVSTRITVVTQFQCTDLNLEEMWALLLYALKIKSDDIEGFLRSWKLPIKRIRQIASILTWIQLRFKQSWGSSTLYEAGKETMIHTERVYNVIQKQEVSQSINHWVNQFESLPIKSRSDLAVTGKDLMLMLNRPSGPWIKECLTMIEKAILEGGLENKRERIKERVLTCNLK